MGDLSELKLLTSYHKGRDDIASDFYLPCMMRAASLDRAVGFFRSSIFVVAWPALRGFVERRGQIRILCSQVLADEDIGALEAGYNARIDEKLVARFRAEVAALLNDNFLRAPARILAALVADRVIDLKVAVLRNEDARAARGRIFHDKVGIFRDAIGNRVLFKGSMNETWAGLAADGNLESVDIAASWMGDRDCQRVDREEEYFEEVWRGTYPGLLVRPFPEIAREEFVAAADKEWSQSLETLLLSPAKPTPGGDDPQGRVLLPHQSSGLAGWAANNRRGILAFATGAGKTFTAVTAIREALSTLHEPVLVVVPDQTLFDQWHYELVRTTADLCPSILRAGAGHADWREHLRNWTAPGDLRRIVLATVQTASSDHFRAEIAGGQHLTIVADEVHRLGSARNQRLLDDRMFGARLGLSATPERYGDPGGTAALLGFFGGILEPRYTLADAIRDKVLTPYFYRPHALRLNVDEASEWRRLSAEAMRLRARIKANDPTPGLERRLAQRFIDRARIVKKAQAKVGLAIQVLTENYRDRQRWLVYCDDTDQLAAVSTALANAGIDAMPYHSQMSGDRGETLKWFARRGGVLTAIKCLDEGVDIPAVTHALILASSKNPREFIQRRGRVLRRAKDKALAFLHDAIVLPPEQLDGGETNALSDDPVTAGELARAIEFATHADNPTAAADLAQIALEAGFDWRKLKELGEEDGDED